MKQLLSGENLSTDYIVRYDTVPQTTETGEPVFSDEAKQLYKLENKVQAVSFFRQISNHAHFEVYLERKLIIWLADEIRKLETAPVPDGTPTDMDDDLPF